MAGEPPRTYTYLQIETVINGYSIRPGSLARDPGTYIVENWVAKDKRELADLIVGLIASPKDRDER